MDVPYSVRLCAISNDFVTARKILFNRIHFNCPTEIPVFIIFEMARITPTGAFIIYIEVFRAATDRIHGVSPR